jgi:ABC-2 type transport system permease protein
MSRRTLHVIRREYIAHVRKRSFVVATVIVPFFMAAFLVVPMLLTVFEPDEQYNVVVVDQTGEIAREFVRALDDTLTGGERRYNARGFEATGEQYEPARERWVAAVEAGEVDILVAIPAAALAGGAVDYITRDVRSLQIMERFEDVLDEIVLRLRLAREGLEYDRVRLLTSGVSMRMRQITASGRMEERDFLSDWGLVFIFVMLLYVLLLTWGITISRSIIEEKSSRVVEVLLSSVKPVDLLLGKVVGIGIAGLTQLSIWSVVGFFITRYGSSMAGPVLANVEVSPTIFLWMVVYFLLGFLLYASIFTVIGSVCSTEQDAQQLQGLVTMPMIVPILVLMLIIQSPNGTASVVLSLIPLFTPMIMLARIILVEPPWWQLGLSVFLMVFSTYLTVSFSARIFRVGILMYGKRPSLRELIRWYRLAG